MDQPSWSWYNTFDRQFNPLADPDPTPAVGGLTRLLDTLTSGLGWRARDIHLFGWGQGGTTALELALAYPSRLGSVISICSSLLSKPGGVSSTPMLLFTRRSPTSAAYKKQDSSARAAFREVEVVDADGPGEGMPASRREWEPIMRFWSELLVREGPKFTGEVYEVVQ